MKKLMIIMAIVAMTSIVGNAATYEENLALVNIPASQITTANAAQILDAAIALTNENVAISVADSKAMSFADIYAKIKSNKLFVNTLYVCSLKYATPAEKEEAFLNFVDTWLELDDKLQLKFIYTYYRWCIQDDKDKIYMSLSAVEQAIAKISSSSSTLKANAIAQMLFCGNNYQNYAKALCEQNFDIVKNAILSGQFYPVFAVFNFVSYTYHIRNDTALVCQLLDNIKWYKPYGKSESTTCPYLSVVIMRYEPILTKLRKQYLETVAENDFQLTTVALAQDKIDGNKLATASIFSKLTGQSTKINIALYLNDNDKLIDTLLAIDNTVSAADLEKCIPALNALDPDYRKADVLKVLRIINKKYTLKLYDDRDTWEPILSKVRALIDTYNN